MCQMCARARVWDSDRSRCAFLTSPSMLARELVMVDMVGGSSSRRVLLRVAGVDMDGIDIDVGLDLGVGRGSKSKLSHVTERIRLSS